MNRNIINTSIIVFAFLLEIGVGLLFIFGEAELSDFLHTSVIVTLTILSVKIGSQCNLNKKDG